MNSLGVVKVHIMLHSEAKLRQVDALFDFDAFIFQRLPETLHLYIIQTAPAPVHTDLNIIGCPVISPQNRIQSIRRFPVFISYMLFRLSISQITYPNPMF